MMDIIASKQVEGTTVTVEMVKATKPGVCVSSVTAALCEKEFLQTYFSNTEISGGGKVESIEILTEREAIVTFLDPAGTQTCMLVQDVHMR